RTGGREPVYGWTGTRVRVDGNPRTGGREPAYGWTGTRVRVDGNPRTGGREPAYGWTGTRVRVDGNPRTGGREPAYGRGGVAPPAGFEPALPPPDGGALSPELRGPVRPSVPLTACH